MNDIINLFKEDVKKREVSGWRRSAKSSTRWTEEDDKLLAELSFKLGHREISKILERSVGAVKARISILRRRGVRVANSLRVPWSEEEDKYLVENLQIKPIDEIADILDRTVMGIRYRIKVLRSRGVKIPKLYCKKWSPEEDDELIRLYRTKSAKEVSEIIGRSLNVVTNRVYTLRCQGREIVKDNFSRWTEDEDRILIKHYSSMELEELSRKLSRSRNSIMARAALLRRKGIKLNRTRLDAWKPKEDKYLTDNYGKLRLRDIAKRLGRTKEAASTRYTYLKSKGLVSEVKGE